MLSDLLIIHFHNLCIAEGNHIWAEIERTKTQLWSDAAARGTTLSGNFFVKLVDAYQKSVAKRADSFVGAMKQAHKDFGYPLAAEDQTEMHALIQRLLAEQEESLWAAFQREVERLGSKLPPNANDTLERTWQVKCAGIRAACLNNLRRYFWELEHVPAMKPNQNDRPSAVLIQQTFNAPVGAVLTGESASALVNQKFDETGQAALLTALKELRLAIEGTHELHDENDRLDLLTNIDQAESELQAEMPRIKKLLMLLGGIGTVVQSLGSAQQAWEAVSGAARAIGLPL